MMQQQGGGKKTNTTAFKKIKTRLHFKATPTAEDDPSFKTILLPHKMKAIY